MGLSLIMGSFSYFSLILLLIMLIITIGFYVKQQFRVRQMLLNSGKTVVRGFNSSSIIDI